MAKILAKLGIIVATSIGFMIATFGVSIIMAIPVWLLWGWIAAGVFDWPDLTLLQSWGLLILCSFLFKTGGNSK